MDLPNDPRAAGFNAADFRDAIKFAMKMGTPNAVDERATFRWKKQRTYNTPTDPAGRPYDWRQPPASDDTPEDVQVDVAVVFSDRSSSDGGTAIARFNSPRVEPTILDVDYELVEGASFVILDSATYEIDFVAPPEGMFDVTVYTIYASAVDEH